jgi:hypothetical protein
VLPLFRATQPAIDMDGLCNGIRPSQRNRYIVVHMHGRRAAALPVPHERDAIFGINETHTARPLTKLAAQVEPAPPRCRPAR